MYRALRNTHLVLGLFGATFFVAYGLSAAQMAYPVYSPRAAQIETDFHVPVDVETSPRALARWLSQAHGIEGALQDVEHDTGGGFSFTVARVGTTFEVEFSPQGQSVHVVTKRHGTVGMLNRVHHVTGIDHGYWALDAWGHFLALASLALIGLAISGTMMWFKRHAERRSGAIVFGAGLAWGLSLLVLMRLA